jgi:hypothetical protein
MQHTWFRLWIDEIADRDPEEAALRIQYLATE